MKTNIITTVKATLLAVLCSSIAVTTASAGDPIPDVDVSIEQSPGGIKKGKTGPDGSATFANVNPGPIVLTLHHHGVATGRQGGSFFAIGNSTGGGKSASGDWKDTSKPFMLEMVVAGRGPQSVTVKVTIKTSELKRGLSN